MFHIFLGSFGFGFCFCTVCDFCSLCKLFFPALWFIYCIYNLYWWFCLPDNHTNLTDWIRRFLTQTANSSQIDLYLYHLWNNFAVVAVVVVILNIWQQRHTKCKKKNNNIIYISFCNKFNLIDMNWNCSWYVKVH